ncbi:MAG: hypothetical protein LC676_11895 [Loktanella sp.]|nr:hypothetical protein [Loktanella sp.]
MTDDGWMPLRPALRDWLSPTNFDSQGPPRQALGRLTQPHLLTCDLTF